MSLTTLQDIAHAAQVHQSTVSRALRDDPRIPQTTRERIRKIASQMGYQADPMLSALSAYRSGKNQRNQTLLAYLTNWPKEHPRGLRWGQNEYFPAAQKRAEQFGYRLETFSLSKHNLKPQRLSSILRARGCPGIIVQDSPYTTETDLEGFETDAFAWCSLGYSLSQCQFPRVCHEPGSSMQTAFRQIWTQGYRRIALWLEDWQDARVAYRWSDAYHGECRRHGVEALHLVLSPNAATQATLLNAYTKQRPDAILTYAATAEIRTFIDSFPGQKEKPAWFVLNKKSAPAGISGIDQHLEMVGAKAVDILISYIRRREYGLAGKNLVKHITGEWKEGK